MMDEQQPSPNVDNTEQLLDEILDSVTGGFTQLHDANQACFQSVVNAINSLTTTQEEPSVVEGLETGVSALVAEGFVLCILLSISIGLMCWQQFAGSWK